MRALAVAHGTYYLLAGIWPLVSIGTFQAVTGDKTDLWLVKTVALLIVVVGASIVTSARHRYLDDETLVLAIGSALALGTVDVFYSMTGVISKVYLYEAPVEAILVGAWLILRARERRAWPI